MTKIQIASDLHGEAYQDTAWVWRYIEPTADFLVVAGDIHSRNYEDQLRELSTKFKHVIALYGNHEWYRRDISWRADKKRLPKNVHVLDRSVWQYRNIVFIGATLWTDFKNQDPFIMYDAQRAINDFRVIGNKENAVNRFQPTEAAAIHVKDKQFVSDMIDKFTDEGKKVIVCTHFMPSYECVHPRWKKDPTTDNLNWYFSADCNDLLNKEGISAWICGHTHDEIDKYVGKTRVVCNPLGYPGENLFSDKIIDV